MQCPHCWSEIFVTPHSFALGEDQDGSWAVAQSRCPSCGRLIVDLCAKEGPTYPVRPVAASRPRLSDDVPDEYAHEHLVANQVLPYSPEASAAIGRRLLHRFLADKVGAGSGELAGQIRQTAGSPELPQYLEEALQTYARVAKLESGSVKSLYPEALTPVEPGEAEWLLDILQPLFELYFVQPARLKRMQNALEERIGPACAPDAAEPLDAGEESGPPLPGESEDDEIDVPETTT